MIRQTWADLQEAWAWASDHAWGITLTAGLLLTIPLAFLVAMYEDTKPLTAREWCERRADQQSTTEMWVTTGENGAGFFMESVDHAQLVRLMRACAVEDDTQPKPCGPDPKGRGRRWWCYR